MLITFSFKGNLNETYESQFEFALLFINVSDLTCAIMLSRLAPRSYVTATQARANLNAAAAAFPRDRRTISIASHHAWATNPTLKQKAVLVPRRRFSDKPDGPAAAAAATVEADEVIRDGEEAAKEEEAKPSKPTQPTSNETVTGEEATHEFQAETRQLLDIVAKSLYSEKEVFIRELISNASDAVEKRRYMRMTGDKIEDEANALEINIFTDKVAR